MVGLSLVNRSKRDGKCKKASAVKGLGQYIIAFYANILSAPSVWASRTRSTEGKLSEGRRTKGEDERGDLYELISWNIYANEVILTSTLAPTLDVLMMASVILFEKKNSDALLKGDFPAKHYSTTAVWQ
jgi:hypothetical protein